MTTVIPPPVLSIDRLAVRMDGRAILRDVNLEVRPGELVTLIGANGSGKTTLLRTILGLVHSTSGSVRIAGAGTGKAGRLVGYTPQRVNLDPDLPLRSKDLVSLGYDGARLGFSLPSRRRRAVVAEMLATVDGEAFADRRVGKLSGGELQRVLIAYAIAGGPKLLLLDEPLANLDLRSERNVVEILAKVARERNIGILLSTHDMNPLLDVTDRIAYIADGRVASGTPDEVLTSESLSLLYGHHVDVLRIHDRLVVVAAREDRAFDHQRDRPVASVI